MVEHHKFANEWKLRLLIAKQTSIDKHNVAIRSKTSTNHTKSTITYQVVG